MNRLTKVLIFSIFLYSFLVHIQGQTIEGFKVKQLKYNRVREAYRDKYDELRKIWKANGIDTTSSITLNIKAIKSTKKFYLLAKNMKGKTIEMSTFDICALSGKKGTKCSEGDGQVPEGKYFINRFNPTSNFFLSLGLNFPNVTDIKRCQKTSSKGMGRDIFIHGDCVSIGCLALTDEVIKLVYIACIEALDRGTQRIIPIEIVWE